MTNLRISRGFYDKPYQSDSHLKMGDIKNTWDNELKLLHLKPMQISQLNETKVIADFSISIEWKRDFFAYVNTLLVQIESTEG